MHCERLIRVKTTKYCHSRKKHSTLLTSLNDDFRLAKSILLQIKNHLVIISTNDI